MRIRHLEYIFSIDKGVRISGCITSFFGRYYYNAIYPGVFFLAFFTDTTNFLVDPYY